ncbi:hypothetical protein pb186bvf_018662 [Paramecium bursaria]
MINLQESDVTRSNIQLLDQYRTGGKTIQHCQTYFRLEELQQKLSEGKGIPYLYTIRIISIFILMVAQIFQRPLWCDFGSLECEEFDDNIVYTLQGFLTIQIFAMIEIFLVLVVWFCKMKEQYKLTRKIKVKRSKKIKLISFTIIAYTIIFLDLLAIKYESQLPAKFNSFIRPVLIILQSRPLQLAIKNYFRVIYGSGQVFNLMAFSLIIFSAIGKILFRNFEKNDDDDSKDPIFANGFLTTVQNLFVFLTNVNTPLRYRDYYQETRWAAVYFIIFQFINVILVLNLIIAVFYSKYEQIMNNDTLKFMNENDRAIDQIVSVYIQNQQKSMTKSLVIPINQHEEKIKSIMQNNYYRYPYLFFVEIISIADFTLIFLYEYDLKHFFVINITLNSLILAEQLIIFTFYNSIGKQLISKQYSQQYQIISIIITITLILFILLNHWITEIDLLITIQLLLMSTRVLRLTKLFLKSQYFQFLVDSIIQIGPYFTELFGVLFIQILLFSSLGQILFGGIQAINRNDDDKYQLVTFNDHLSSMITCWHLMMVNDWEAIQDSFFEKNHKQGHIYELYFIIYYISVVLINLNVTIALIINYLVNRWHKFQQEFY